MYSGLGRHAATSFRSAETTVRKLKTNCCDAFGKEYKCETGENTSFSAEYETENDIRDIQLLFSLDAVLDTRQ